MEIANKCNCIITYGVSWKLNPNTCC